jgi:hypothetical protein
MPARRQPRWLSALGAACAAAAALALAPVANAAQDVPLLEIVPNDSVYLRSRPDEPVVGRIVDTLPDQGVKIIPNGQTDNPITYPGSDIDHIIRRQTAGDAVALHGAGAVAAQDVQDVIRTFKFGLANNAKDAAIAFAKDALGKLDKTRTGELAEQLIPVLIDGGDLDGALAIAKAGTDANPLWTFGYEQQAKILDQEKRDDDLLALVKTWLERQPAAYQPNLVMAHHAERSGDIKGARAAWLKAYDLHQDPVAGVGYARTSLMLGHAQDALDTANALIAKDTEADQARALAGAAYLALGNPGAAGPLLELAVNAKLPPDVLDLSRYNLGLVRMNAGKTGDAKDLWSAITDPTVLPAAELGLAMIDRKPYTRQDVPPALQGVAQEYAACLALTAPKPSAPANLDRSNDRQAFLLLVSAVVTNPSEEAVAALAKTPGPESLRWQAYGDLIARRYTAAAAVLAQLPDNDGYAAVYRVYLAEANKDSAGAAKLFDKVKDAIDPPADYVKELDNVFQGANDRTVNERFLGTIDDLLTRGWHVESPGTGITVHPAAGRLLFDGTQSAGDDPITRVWLDEPAAQVRTVRAVFDAAGLDKAVGGLALTDTDRTTGIAIAVIGDGKTGWREEKDGKWGDWKDLPLIPEGTQAVLTLEFAHGTATAVGTDSANNTQRVVLTSPALTQATTLSISLFGAADPGVAWRLGVEDFSVDLRPDTH